MSIMYKDLPESRRKRNYYLVKDMSFNFNEEKYKERLMTLATRQFTHNIELLASRLIQKVNNPESMKLDYIDIDMKGFKVLIETKDSKFYVRAIWCAEDSMIVAPHLRYICTEKSK